MSFAGSVRSCFSKYATFSGRATRSEFWWFYLFFFITVLAADIAGHVVFGPSSVEDTSNDVFAKLLWWVNILPFAAVACRRLHDSGRSGWYLFFLFVFPFVLFYFFGLAWSLSDSTIRALGDSDFLRDASEIFGIIGLTAIVILYFGLGVLVNWSLISPTDPQANKYGPVPTS